MSELLDSMNELFALERHNRAVAFITESNRIEGIKRPPTPGEVTEYLRFMALGIVTINDMKHFVRVYQKGAKLREKKGMNVRVGQHTPPPGGDDIVHKLAHMLLAARESRGDAEAAYHLHHAYETLHPFMDGNGRSGRMLWLWMMYDAPLGFLHTWYYQSLQYGRKS